MAIFTVLDIAGANWNGRTRAQYHRIPASWSKESCEDFAGSIRQQGRHAHIVEITPEFHHRIMNNINTGHADGTGPDANITLDGWN